MGMRRRDVLEGHRVDGLYGRLCCVCLVLPVNHRDLDCISALRDVKCWRRLWGYEVSLCHVAHALSCRLWFVLVLQSGTVG